MMVLMEAHPTLSHNQLFSLLCQKPITDFCREVRSFFEPPYPPKRENGGKIYVKNQNN